MKRSKYLLLLCLFVLCACELPLYTLSYGEKSLIVGRDSDTKEMVLDHVEYNEEGIISDAVIYLSDIQGEVLMLDGYPLEKGIKESCSDLSGKYEEDKNVCVLSKKVYRTINTVLLYGNILNDDTDRLDHVEVIAEEIR